MIRLFTDGACKSNGKSNSKASYAYFNFGNSKAIILCFYVSIYFTQIYNKGF